MPDLFNSFDRITPDLTVGAIQFRHFVAFAGQIKVIDREFDRLVCEFYGLTDEEIGGVEDATNT